MNIMLDQAPTGAEAYRLYLNFPFIAISGSNGKTTVKSMLAHILRQAGRVYEFSGESDTAAEIARELAAIQPPQDWAVLKIGAAIPGESRTAARLIKPDLAIITNIGEAHLDHYERIEDIAAAKLELLNALTPGGIAILNRDNEYTRLMGLNRAGKVIYYGLSSVSDYYADAIQHHGPEGTSFTIHSRGGSEASVRMALYSLGDVYNALAAYATAAELGIPAGTITNALEHGFTLPEGRGRLHSFPGLHILDDTHDATPQSFYKSTKSLVNFRRYAKRLIFVMGKMTEIGGQTRVMHTMMGHYLAGMPIDIAILVGEYAAAAATPIATATGRRKRVITCATVEEACAWLQKNLKDGDVVLVEGGETINMSAIVSELVRFGRDTGMRTPSANPPLHSLTG